MRRLWRAAFVPLVAGALALGGCSADEERVAPYPVELPDLPEDVQILEEPVIGTQLTTLLLGLNQAAGAWAGAAAMFDVTDTGPQPVIDYYDEWLTDQGWDRAGDPTELNGAPAALWEGDDQRVMIALVTLRDRDIALLLSSSDRF